MNGPALRCLTDIAGAMCPQAGWQFGGDALHMQGAEHCRIERNHFMALGCNAIYLEGYNYRNMMRVRTSSVCWAPDCGTRCSTR